MAVLEMEIISGNSKIITVKWYFNVDLCYISHYSNKTNPELYLSLYCSVSVKAVPIRYLLSLMA